MTAIYTTSGDLTNPVNDLSMAQEYLATHGSEMEQYVYPDELRAVVFLAQWTLTGVDSWKVQVITDRELTPAEEAQLSEWISGQNSDGLGEGFEQQDFAQTTDYDEDDEESYSMSSFDWQTNDCPLVRVR